MVKHSTKKCTEKWDSLPLADSPHWQPLYVLAETELSHRTFQAVQQSLISVHNERLGALHALLSWSQTGQRSMLPLFIDEETETQRNGRILEATGPTCVLEARICLFLHDYSSL